MSAAPTIPIENIYYLFCYAWDRFEEAQAIPLGGAASPDLPALLAKVLLHGTRTLLRRGLDRGYREENEDLATVRGRIALRETLQLQMRQIRRLHCSFEELSEDILHNRVLKASLNRLARAPRLSPELAHELRALARSMPNVSDLELTRSVFTRVRLHRNNAYYSLLMKVAELAFDCLMPNPSGSGFMFEDVLRNEDKMAGVFEAFVRNFYKVERPNGYDVEGLAIQWDAEIISAGEIGRLPEMRTDIFLRSSARDIIIDTKYYADALQSYRGSNTFHSGNLYQLFSYLKHAAGRGRAKEEVEGILLYPRVGFSVDSEFRTQGHSIRIATIDLAQPWRTIAKRLVALAR